MLTSFPAGFLNRYLKSLNILARSKRNASTIQIFSSSAGRLMSSNTWSPALLFMNYWLVVNPTIIFLITRFMHNKWFMHLVRLWTYFLSGKKNLFCTALWVSLCEVLLRPLHFTAAFSSPILSTMISVQGLCSCTRFPKASLNWFQHIYHHILESKMQWLTSRSLYLPQILSNYIWGLLLCMA